MLSKGLKSNLIFNLILITTFSVSVNTFVEFQNINITFYILFHLSFIYFLFYHYQYTIYFNALFYGVLFDIFLLNEIGSHLLVFIILISVYNLLKKYLFLLTPYQISLTIFITLNITLFTELIIAFLFNNIDFSFFQLIKYIIISLIIFIPSIFILNKLDK